MNYLAHLALADLSDASLIGNLLGDFAKGTHEHLLENHPEDLVEGMMMHRSIDRFTDAHPHFKSARELLVPERRRFAGIVVDIFFDHFLSIHWNRFYDTQLSDFIENCYQTLERYPEWWIGRFADAYPYMRKQNWLACYKDISGIELTLQRVSQHGKHTTPIEDCFEDFEKNYTEFEAIFLAFYPELQQHAKGLIARP